MNKQTKYWKCPKCGGILEKGFSDVLAGAKIIGEATCGGCGAKYSQSEVYEGKFDVDDTEIFRTVLRQRATEGRTSAVKPQPNLHDAVIITRYTAYTVVRNNRENPKNAPDEMEMTKTPIYGIHSKIANELGLPGDKFWLDVCREIQGARLKTDSEVKAAWEETAPTFIKHMHLYEEFYYKPTSSQKPETSLPTGVPKKSWWRFW